MSYKTKEKMMRNQAGIQTSCFHACALCSIIAMCLLMAGCVANFSSIDSPVTEVVDAQHEDAGDGNIETAEDNNSHRPLIAEGEPVSDPTFPTFDNTGLEVCTNDEGRPLIFMFSTSQCSHCRWAGSAFDFVVRFLGSDGLIEAHHYDLFSGDDLLTEEIESEVPADKLEVYKRGNPRDLVPYYNFGCAYDRIGNGYERENDLVAEGEEMRRVIEALMEMVSEGE